METEKKIIIRGVISVKECNTFFYLKDKKETKKSKIFTFESFKEASLENFSHKNWRKDNIYKGFNYCYCYSKKDVREELIELLQNEELI